MLVKEQEPLPGPLIRLLQEAGRIAVLSGAGISAESGVPTFRGENGLWKNFLPEELATPQAFAEDPALVWEWYNWRRSLVAECQPNAAHHVVAWLEQRYPEFALITQNVDGLHARAGSRKLFEMHGNLFHKRCLRNEAHVQPYPIEETTPMPTCSVCGSLARPHIVWFGEALDPYVYRGAELAADESEVLLVVGTSAVVYPVAGFPRMAQRNGAKIVEINPELTPLSPSVDFMLQGKASFRMQEIGKALGLAVS